jgi:putative aldouronate transport system substrate-binding protein
MRIGTMLAGGDYPDIIAQSEQNADMIKGGAFVNLDSLLASGNYPLLAEHVRVNSKIRWTGGEVADGIYILPNYNRFYGGNPEQKPSNANAFFIQKAVLEDLGYPDLSNMTLDTYFGMLRDYKAANPTIDGVETVAFLLHTNPNFWATTNMPAVLQGSPNNGGVVVDITKSPHEPRIYADDDYAKRTWKYLNDMYLEGLIDPESFSLTGDQYDAKMASGAVLGTFHQTWAVGTPENTLNSEGKSNRTWVVTTPTFDNIPHYYAWSPTMNVQQGFGISVDAEDPAMILAFIEVLMSEYWQKVLFWGIEGEDYLVGDDGLYYRTQEMRDEQTDLIWQASNQARAFRDQMPKHQGFWPDGNADSAGNQPSEFFAGLSEYDQGFLSAYGYQNWSGFVGTIPAVLPNYYPAWQAQLSDAAREADSQMGDLGREYIPQLVMAKEGEFDAIWEAYVTQMDRVDKEAYLDSMRAHVIEYGWE